MAIFDYLKVSFIALLVFMVNSAFAGSFSAPETKSKLVFYAAYAAEDRVAILDGSTPDRRLRGGHNLKDQSTYHTAAFGIGYWFPLYARSDMQFHGLAYVEHTPGPTVDVLNRQTNSGNEPDDAAWAEIKTNRTNFGLGVNVVVPFYENMFFVGAVTGGISRRHVDMVFADMDFGDDSGPFGDDTENNGGITTSQPFIGCEAGIGKVLTDHSSVYAFVSANASRKNEHFIIGSSGGDGEAGAFIRDPNHWWKIGIAITRTIDFL